MKAKTRYQHKEIASRTNKPQVSTTISTPELELFYEFALIKNRSKSAPNLSPTSNPEIIAQLEAKKTFSPKKPFSGNEKTRFFLACKMGNITLVTYLVKSNVRVVMDKNSEGCTGLHVASSCGHKNLVKYLLSQNSQIDSKDKQLRTPLHCAAISGHLQIVRYLLKKGHDPNARNVDRNACLHYLVRINENFDKLKKTLDMIVKAGAVIDVKNKFDETPLQFAAAIGNVEVCIYLIKNNAQVDTRNKFGASALQQAVIMSQKEVVKLLLENKADPTLKKEGKYGNILEVAKKNSELLDLLQPWVKVWNSKKSEGSINDEIWRTKPLEVKIKESSLTDASNATIGYLEELSRTIKEPLVSEFEGWVEENIKCQVPEQPDNKSFIIESENYYYSTHFYKHKHQNYYGTLEYPNKEKEPFIVSIKTEEELDNNEFKALFWLVKGFWYLSIPIEHVESQNCKRLCKYVTALISKKFETKINVKMELINQPLPIVSEGLYQLEMNDPQVPRILSVGVIYSKSGQNHESEYLSNSHEETSNAYRIFLKLLGNKIILQHHKGFKANLDVSENQKTGKNAIHHKKDGYEIMYHTATLIPKTSEDEDDGQQILRKQFIGNDVVGIVFQEGGNFNSLIMSKFLYVYIVVRPLEIMGKLHFQLTVIKRESVPDFGPPICSPAIYANGRSFEKLLRAKVINAYHSALRTDCLAKKLIYPHKASLMTSIVNDLKNIDN